MTVLIACQDAISRLIGRRPDAVFASQGEIETEIASLANEAATDIMKSNDWQRLTKIHTISGDGSTTAFHLPEDYDRMTVASSVQDRNVWFWGYTHIATAEEWLWLTNSQTWLVSPGAWTILGGQMLFRPAPASGTETAFPYVSNAYGTMANGQPISAFSRDDDVFLLNNRLLTLALIWRWKALKVMDYQEDMRNYEIALSQEQTRDRGPRVTRSGIPYSGRWPLAWPWELG